MDKGAGARVTRQRITVDGVADANHPGGLTRPKLCQAAYFLRIHTRHVTGPASLSLMGRPASLRASFI